MKTERIDVKTLLATWQSRASLTDQELFLVVFDAFLKMECRAEKAEARAEKAEAEARRAPPCELTPRQPTPWQDVVANRTPAMAAARARRDAKIQQMRAKGASLSELSDAFGLGSTAIRAVLDRPTMRV